MENNNSKSGGIGFVGLLTILFIALKLTDVIDWSWVWVLSPIWIMLVLGISLFLFLTIISLTITIAAIIIPIIGRRSKWKKN
ncbi:hypothetical protein [Paenilisteria rocourtiae]|uniref:Uncharacterized protein n=1 Tax=Listeria rocourtiae TaxID=647910 RepID=A0A4R6ZPS5_9LIST|nr:hypothetical protein [Listeria rocourtiae]TDR54204.1 hypothetical protein DFP96_103305 [Listeria rocourtiae]